MNLFELFVKIGVDDQASGKLKDIGSQLGNGLKTAAKVGTAAVGVVSTAIIALGKIGLDYNSQMEKYTTNFTTMLGSQEAAVQKVQELKEFAASTPLSMDDLARGTQTLLAFGVASENSTGILRQLGDIALGDADKMQRLSTAFGKATASGKVTGDTVQQMIDAGWNPLIQISKAAGETMEETQKRMSAGAVSVDELKAAMEAVTTGTGQFAGGMEAASHTTQGLISTLQDNARALVGEVFMPISEGIAQDVLPSAIDAINELSYAFREGGINGMIDAAGEIIGNTLGTFTSNLPEFVSMAVDIVGSLLNGIRSNLGSVVQGATETVDSLIDGIANMLPDIIVTGALLLGKLAVGVVKAIPDLVAKIPQIIKAVVNGFKSNSGEFSDIGRDIVNGVWRGIQSMISTFTKSVTNFFSGIVSSVKETLGIHSPSTVFASIGGFMAKGLDEGWGREYNDVKRKIEGGLDFGTASVGFTASGLTLPHSTVSRGIIGGGFGTNGDQETNIVIPVILDGKQIGEASYKYIRKKERMVGA